MLEEKLKRDILSIVIEGKAKAAFPDKIGLPGYIAFPQQDRLRRNIDLFVEMRILFPIEGEIGGGLFTAWHNSAKVRHIFRGEAEWMSGNLAGV